MKLFCTTSNTLPQPPLQHNRNTNESKHAGYFRDITGTQLAFAAPNMTYVPQHRVGVSTVYEQHTETDAIPKEFAIKRDARLVCGM